MQGKIQHINRGNNMPCDSSFHTSDSLEQTAAKAAVTAAVKTRQQQQLCQVGHLHQEMQHGDASSD